MRNTIKTGSSEYNDITQHEIHALKMDLNLADAHTHQSQSNSQQKNIVEKLPRLWNESERVKQVEMEEKFLTTFFRVLKQEDALKGHKPLLVYASSIAMVMVANYLMKKKMSVALIEPCFDNLHDILMHMQVPLSVLREEWLSNPKTLYRNLKENITADAIFIVDPNNPTGHTLFKHHEDSYSELIRYCLENNKLLIIDYCFAPFVDYAPGIDVPPIYKMLHESGIQYITIEDTGKTWPLQDTKVAMLKVCDELYEEIYNIHTSYLLNVSPFILNLVTEYILDSEKDSFASVYSLLIKNSKIGKRILASSLLKYQEPQASVSVMWLKITNPKVKATDLQKFIFEHSGVYVLPGTYFFWNSPQKGERFIRIALARDTDVFTKAIKMLRKAMDEYEKRV